MDTSVQTTNYNPHERQHSWGERPGDLPVLAAVWDVARPPQPRNSTFVTKAMFEAVTQIEAAQTGNQA